MKNIKKIGLYNPYLDVLGGGEKYILSILKVFDDLDFQIDLFWKNNLKHKIKERFGFQYKNLNFISNIFNNKSIFKKLFNLCKYDLFFYVTDGSYFFSTAKKNFIYAMAPDKNLYQSTSLNRLKLINWQFFTHSFFNQKHLNNWGIKAKVLYPYIDNVFFINKNIKKEKIILSVGRFFSHLHSKNHKIIIENFKKLKILNKDFSSYKLVLAGGLKKEDKNYFNSLKEFIKNDPDIILKPNIAFDDLINLYKISSFFWHFAGYRIDENQFPEKVEHLGITPLEAMAAENIVFSYNAGGPKELINDGKNGFLFNNEDELMKKILMISKNKNLAIKIRKNGFLYIKENLSYEKFKKNVIKLFL
ncbi:MAG: glycosyltransferase [Patescibacteria group bacterium]|nr:glycosyltransferase [Patescibacteria group bacterium]